MRDYPKVIRETREEWREWLRVNHATSGTVWLVMYKKTKAAGRLSYDCAVEEALCFGWIDSLPRAFDDDRTMILMSPRRKKSPWSALNKKRVGALIASGRMEPAGLERITQAKANGSWTILNDIDKLKVPADLAAALKKNPKANIAFRALAPSAKRGLLWWIKSAKSDATRAMRIATTVRKTAGGRAKRKSGG